MCWYSKLILSGKDNNGIMSNNNSACSCDDSQKNEILRQFYENKVLGYVNWQNHILSKGTTICFGEKIKNCQVIFAADDSAEIKTNKYTDKMLECSKMDEGCKNCSFLFEISGREDEYLLIDSSVLTDNDRLLEKRSNLIELRLVNTPIEINNEQVENVKKAIEKINSELCDCKGIWKCFSELTYGMTVNVEIDYLRHYEAETTDDALAGYCHSIDELPKITLFATAIQEFCAQHKISDVDIINFYSYVLAHEMFHFWHDYRICLSLYHSDPDKKETIAEYFALRYLWELYDNSSSVCFEVMYHERKENLKKNSPIKAYGKAIEEFGEIWDEDSVKCFNEKKELHLGAAELNRFSLKK